MSHLRGSSCQNLVSLAENSSDEDGPSKVPHEPKERLMFVSKFLPLGLMRRRPDGGWDLDVDEESIYIAAKREMEGKWKGGHVIHVGCLPKPVPMEEREQLTKELWNRFAFVPVFVEGVLWHSFYECFCMQCLYPLMHAVLPLAPTSSGRFKQEHWIAFMKVNKEFSNIIGGMMHPRDRDHVWIHDYHLMALPGLLRKRFHGIRCGTFLHITFPSSELFRTFPKREDLIRSMLNADLIGFQSFEYARNFVSCCSRMLNLELKTDSGKLTVDYFGRRVVVRACSTGISPPTFLRCLSQPDTLRRQGELLTDFKDRWVMLGIDYLDAFKGVELKLYAFEALLDQRSDLQGKIVMVQVTDPEMVGWNSDMQELASVIKETVQRINSRWSTKDYTPVLWINRQVGLQERCALFSAADCLVETSTKDGMNLMPYQYVVCRHGEDGKPGIRQSTIVLSEFMGCSAVLSCAITANPWSVDDVADAMLECYSMPEHERSLRHSKHWLIAKSKTAEQWTNAHVADLKAACANHSMMRCYSLGLDAFKVVALDANLRKLPVEALQKVFWCSRQRAILLDYDGTLQEAGKVSMLPSEKALGLLSSLCADKHNIVNIISGRQSSQLQEWFSGVSNLGLYAEHGFSLRTKNTNWKWERLVEAAVDDDEEPLGGWYGAATTPKSSCHSDMRWKEEVESIVQLYTEQTEGSSMEVMESAVVWYYNKADPDLAQLQAKSLMDYLHDKLMGTKAEATHHHGFVEIRSVGVGKKMAVSKFLDYHPDLDFLLCIGQDSSNEGMFVEALKLPTSQTAVYCCTVGQKRGSAPFYLESIEEVFETLSGLTNIREACPSPANKRSSSK
eukprot:TRINITY_DN102060_c0_g1_i1.p1 TRINITY_DN102060_c0_g1~~TRINITY_DN102060_c0_g1_i1.p1  ORF type:complete len:845 (+),score=200.07 TRINITY_DN102060_c0_g1_i1:203-2737(+)